MKRYPVRFESVDVNLKLENGKGKEIVGLSERKKKKRGMADAVLTEKK